LSQSSPLFCPLGNKSDLEELREVQRATGQQLATNLNATFLECSAKTGVNTDLAFERLVREIRHARDPSRARQKPGKH
jgi:GTPase SAR1 family protein